MCKKINIRLRDEHKELEMVGYRMVACKRQEERYNLQLYNHYIYEANREDVQNGSIKSNVMGNKT